jgi:hypothetical protein
MPPPGWLSRGSESSDVAATACTPCSASRAIAWRAAGSSSGCTTDPSGASRSGTSRQRWRGTNGSGRR